jgi:hypothetical protein
MADIDTTYLDSDTDSIKAARPAIYATTLKVNQITSGNGAAIVGFTQTGSSIIRDLASKGNESFTAKDFAVGDGITNESPNFTTAFNQAAGKEVLITSGIYLLNTNVTAPVGSTARVQQGVIFTGSGIFINVLMVYDKNKDTAIAGSAAKVDKAVEQSTYKISDIGGLWGGKTYFFNAVSKTFLTGDGSAGSPVAASVSYANNNGSEGDVCSGLDIAIIRSNSGSKTVFGRNIIVGCESFVSSAKLVGMEIDIEPSAGATSAGTGAGMYINGFNLPDLGAAIQIGGVSGGAFNNGILISAVAGAGLAANAGTTMTSLIDSTQGNFTGGAVNLKNQHSIQLKAVGGGTGSYLYTDTSDNLFISTKNYILTKGSNTTEGSPLMVVADSAGQSAMTVQVGRGSPPNAADSTVKINGQSVTGRSISAGGTINASGADYAEYEKKSAECGKILKGDIVGFDSEGLLTDKWDTSLSFGIKSTSPCLVGGDIWAGGLLEPVKPVPPPCFPVKPAACSTSRKCEVDADYSAKLSEWEKECKGIEQDTLLYENQLDEYIVELEQFTTEHARIRAQYDRIAYCGKVPLNLKSGFIGGYIIPIKTENGGIGAECVKNPTFNQFLICIGKVRKLISETQVEVVVKS